MNRLMRLPEVKHMTGLSRSTIYKKIELGEFPKQIKLGMRTVAWSSEEIEAWINDKIEIPRHHDKDL